MGYFDRGDIKQELEANVLSEGVKFDSLSSSDSRNLALDWLLNADLERLMINDSRLKQRFILAVLAFECEDLQSSNWLSDENECTWNGIECDEDNVTSLRFSE